jgi:hypothetical protein
VFAACRKEAGTDLEATEKGARAGLHRAGVWLLAQLLKQHDAPATSPCACGQQARYYDRRERQLLTALGEVKFERAYYVCPHCSEGHSPRDRELNLENQSCSPGVHRMLATVGSDASFEKGRDQREVLAGIGVTAKAVERHAEAIGADIEARQQSEIGRAKQLELPAVAAPAVPPCISKWMARACPWCAPKPRVARAGRAKPARAKLNSVACSPKPRQMRKAARSATRVPPPTSALSRAPNRSAYVFTPKLGSAVGAAPQKRVILADGAVWIWNLAAQHFPGAVEIVDLYHARLHLHDLCAKLLPMTRSCGNVF